MNTNPIGIFDSGVGGLTVTKEIVDLLPNEDIVYLGDTARVPYGTRSKKIITEFALQLTKFLLNKNIKFLVVACNTVSATCLSEIQELSPVPVIGVIQPAVDQIVRTSTSGRVGILGTNATISSKIYEDKLHASNPQLVVISRACPLFVPIVEEGLEKTEIAKLTAEYYLKELDDIDTLHLGCTHYPLLRNVIQDIVGHDVQIIDSARPVAQELKEKLTQLNLLNTQSNYGSINLYLTDASSRAKNFAHSILNTDHTKHIFGIDI